MSKVEVRPIPPTAVVASPLQAASFSDNSPGIRADKDASLGAQKLPPSATVPMTSSSLSAHPNCAHCAMADGPGFVVTLLPSLVSAVMVIAGWYVVNKAQSNRERRKQIREYASDLRDALEELEALTISYHTADREEAKEQEIISKLGRFEKACSTLPRFLHSQKFFKAVPPTKLTIDGRRLQVLRKSMTLDHFGDEHTGALSRQDGKILNLELASVEMQDELERVRIDSLD